MPTKAELYAQMADKVATQLTGSWQEWAGFLTTASRLYKYPFHEQLMIYAQRPDATACAEYDLWNEKMGRYVRRGSKGIALVDDSWDRPRLRYVFDISDTGTREHSRTPWLWQLEERHLDSVQAMLERTYDVSGDDLAGQLTEVAGKLAEEYWTEHQQDFFYIVDGSFLEEYDEYNIFDIMAGRYSNKSNIDVWLKGHCGDAIYVDRMTREAECIMHPALSAILSIQPSVLDEIMSNTTMTGRGLIARFLYASPPSRIGSRVFRTQPIPPEVTAAYRSLIFRLMALPIDGDAHTVRLSEKAFDLMADYFQEHEKFLVGEGQAISDWASKYIGAVLRIAGLLHCADMEDDKAEVTASTMSKAIQIGKYFLAHSTYAYSMMGTDLAIQKAKFVLAKLKKKNVSAIKRSELFQMCRGKFFKKTEEIFPTLELLEGHGYIRLEEPERQSVGRPADVKIIVNPAA